MKLITELEDYVLNQVNTKTKELIKDEKFIYKFIFRIWNDYLEDLNIFFEGNKIFFDNYLKLRKNSNFKNDIDVYKESIINLIWYILEIINPKTRILNLKLLDRFNKSKKNQTKKLSFALKELNDESEKTNKSDISLKDLYIRGNFVIALLKDEQLQTDIIKQAISSEFDQSFKELINKETRSDININNLNDIRLNLLSNSNKNYYNLSKTRI